MTITPEELEARKRQAKLIADKYVRRDGQEQWVSENDDYLADRKERSAIATAWRGAKATLLKSQSRRAQSQVAVIEAALELAFKLSKI